MCVEVLDSIVFSAGDQFTLSRPIGVDIVSLIMRYLLEPKLSLLEPLFTTWLVDLFCFVLSSVYFVVGGGGDIMCK